MKIDEKGTVTIRIILKITFDMLHHSKICKIKERY